MLTGTNSTKKIVVIIMTLLLAICLSGCQQNDEGKYKEAQSLMSKGEYAKAAEKFGELGSYQDSTLLAMYCKAINAAENGQYDAAFTTFETLGDFKDSNLLTQYYTGRGLEANASEENWRNWVLAAQSYQSLGLFRDAAERMESCLQNAYNVADKYASSEDTISAYNIFIALSGYKDSYDRAVIPMYELGIKYREEGKWVDSISVFTTLGSYSDSATQIKTTCYAEGVAKRDAQDWDGARNAFEQAGKYEDAQTQIKATWYAEGVARREAGEWKEAINAFQKAGSYEDATDQIYATYYARGIAQREAGDWLKAVESFKSAKEYSDAKDQILATYYTEGLALRDDKKWDDAIAALKKAKDYSDAKDQIKETIYQHAADLETEGQQESAYTLFLSVSDYKDAFARASKPYYDIGIELRDAGKEDEAISAFEKAGSYEDAKTQIQMLYYEKGNRKYESGDIAGALVDYTAAGDYRDAKSKVQAIKYAQGNQYIESKQWDDAIKVFLDIITYEDSAQKIQYAKYQLAGELVESGQYRSAIMIYEEIQDYNDVSSILETLYSIQNTTASAQSDIDSHLSWNIYSGTKKVSDYHREDSDEIHMSTTTSYSNTSGVFTFRNNAFRKNASFGTVKTVDSLKVLWKKDLGSARGATETYYGVGWPGQPAIVEWDEKTIKHTNINETKAGAPTLREIILAGMDGNIYFLDLADGSLTRNSIKLGYPMKASPSIYPNGVPYMSIGQHIRKMKVKTGKIGLRQYNLSNQKELTLIDGLDGKIHRPISNIGSFETSALIDANSDTMITVGSNGMLYLVTLGTKLDQTTGDYSFSPTEIVLTSKGINDYKENESQVAVESSIAMFEKYVFYADMGGLLRCVDVNTLTPMWVADTEDSVMAAIALDQPTLTSVDLYTANTLNMRKAGNVAIRKFDALSGQELWKQEITVQKEKEAVGFVASPVIGEGNLKDTVFFTVNGLNDEGRSALGLDDTTYGALIALKKEDGSILWAKGLEGGSISSPSAVYNSYGEGWIIQCTQKGDVLILEGLTGKEVTSLRIDGKIEASPAVFNDVMIVGTTGKDSSYVYAIKIGE